MYLHHFIQLFCSCLFPLHFFHMLKHCANKREGIYWRASILTLLKGPGNFLDHHFCYLHRLRACFLSIHGAFSVIKMTHPKSLEAIQGNVIQQKREH